MSTASLRHGLRHAQATTDDNFESQMAEIFNNAMERAAP
jgi:hypothetical protein